MASQNQPYLIEIKVEIGWQAKCTTRSLQGVGGHHRKRRRMTKTLLLTTLVASALASTAFGTTTDELTLTSGATTVTILDNGAGDLTSAAGTVTYSNASFNGWNILITSGTSNSPTLNPFGIDIASLTATCNGGACATQSLKIDYSDINFNVPVGAGGFST